VILSAFIPCAIAVGEYKLKHKHHKNAIKLLVAVTFILTRQLTNNA
jgi:hypothetical protein